MIHLNNIKLIFIAFAFLLLTSCKDNNRRRYDEIYQSKSIEFEVEINNNQLEIYNKKTKELITQIIDNDKEVFFISNCVLEVQLNGFVYNPSNKYLLKFKEKLKVKDSIHLMNQLNLSDKFKITKELIPDKRILTEKEIDSFDISNRQERKLFWDWLNTNCEHGYSYISKPIFNENYNFAIIEIGNVCGKLCGGGETRLYEFVNGKWEFRETIDRWVS